MTPSLDKTRSSAARYLTPPTVGFLSHSTTVSSSSYFIPASSSGAAGYPGSRKSGAGYQTRKTSSGAGYPGSRKSSSGAGYPGSRKASSGAGYQTRKRVFGKKKRGKQKFPPSLKASLRDLTDTGLIELNHPPVPPVRTKTLFHHQEPETLFQSESPLYSQEPEAPLYAQVHKPRPSSPDKYPIKADPATPKPPRKFGGAELSEPLPPRRLSREPDLVEIHRRVEEVYQEQSRSYHRRSRSYEGPRFKRIERPPNPPLLSPSYSTR